MGIINIDLCSELRVVVDYFGNFYFRHCIDEREETQGLETNLVLKKTEVNDLLESHIDSFNYLGYC